MLHVARMRNVASVESLLYIEFQVHTQIIKKEILTISYLQITKRSQDNDDKLYMKTWINRDNFYVIIIYNFKMAQKIRQLKATMYDLKYMIQKQYDTIIIKSI